jgi:hypothetical protein
MLNWKRGKRQFSAQDYGTGLQTILDIKNSTNKFMKFAMNCDSGTGPSNWKSMKKLYKEVDVVLLHWFNWKQVGASVSENTGKENLEGLLLQSDAHEPGFEYMTDADITRHDE